MTIFKENGYSLNSRTPKRKLTNESATLSRFPASAYSFNNISHIYSASVRSLLPQPTVGASSIQTLKGCCPENGDMNDESIKEVRHLLRNGYRYGS
nr:6937_t:CDS:2 [Entrophospora candida]